MFFFPPLFHLSWIGFETNYSNQRKTAKCSEHRKKKMRREKRARLPYCKHNEMLVKKIKNLMQARETSMSLAAVGLRRKGALSLPTRLSEKAGQTHAKKTVEAMSRTSAFKGVFFFFCCFFFIDSSYICFQFNAPAHSFLLLFFKCSSAYRFLRFPSLTVYIHMYTYIYIYKER